MIDFPNRDGDGPVVIPKQTSFTCRTCTKDKPHDHFGKMRGTRNTECLVCARERWTNNRRTRLEKRKCLRCRLRKPFDSFPVTMRNGRKRLGPICQECASEKLNEDHSAEPGDHRAPIALPPGMEPGTDTERTGTTSSLDFTIVAQTMLYPGKPDYRALTADERTRVYVVSRELARRYSPLWKPYFDEVKSPADVELGPWAIAFLDAAVFGCDLPVVLIDYIAAQVSAAPIVEQENDDAELLSIDTLEMASGF